MSKERPRVLMDVDGPLADFLTPCLQIINDLCKSELTLEDMKDWNIFRSLGVPLAIEEETYRIMGEPGWCSQLEVQRGAKYGIAEISKIADIYFVTSPLRSNTWAREREQWLWKHFGVDGKQIVSTAAKYLCVGDFLVDDRVSNLDEWKIHHPNGCPVIWDMCTNVSVESRFDHTDDWVQLLRWIEEFKEEK